MSSSATLTLINPIKCDEWMAFCESKGISYSPNTVGQSTFYSASTEISLSPHGSVRKDASGRPDWSTAKPPEEISKISVSTYFMGDLGPVGEVLNSIAIAFPCTVSSAPELAHLAIELPQTHDIEEIGGYMSTDFVEAWTFADGVYEAIVDAGPTKITQAGALWKVEISGVDRGRFIDLNHAFAFAGRAYWNWWYGPRPDVVPERK
jgi:hypothetical protein